MYIKVRVVPESRTELFRKQAADRYDVAVREKARAGRANTRVLELLREHFSEAKRLYSERAPECPQDSLDRMIIR